MVVGVATGAVSFSCSDSAGLASVVTLFTSHLVVFKVTDVANARGSSSIKSPRGSDWAFSTHTRRGALSARNRTGLARGLSSNLKESILASALATCSENPLVTLITQSAVIIVLPRARPARVMARRDSAGRRAIVFDEAAVAHAPGRACIERPLISAAARLAVGFQRPDARNAAEVARAARDTAV